MLEDYKEALRCCADQIPDWMSLSKNDLCREYVKNKDNEQIQNCYFSAIMYRYWNLISKYYYMSNNVASPEDCYEWLVDSVYTCVKLASWEDPKSSIYKDPNGPDKVINRCMKCARLTYYQFINRKKRRDNFGMLSIDELSESFGTTIAEPEDTHFTDRASEMAIHDYVRDLFIKKDYFSAIMIDCIVHQEVFDEVVSTTECARSSFNIKKLTKFISEINNEYVIEFSKRYNIEEELVNKGISYFISLRPSVIKAKIRTVLERLQHDSFIKLLRGD